MIESEHEGARVDDQEQRLQRSNPSNLTYVELDETASPKEIADYLRKKGEEILAREDSSSEPPGDR